MNGSQSRGIFAKIFDSNFACGIALLASIALGVVLRCMHLDADNPWNLTWSQGIVTDGFWYSDAAISKVMGIISTVANTAFNQLMYTHFATTLLSLTGIGISQINFISVIPGLLSALFLGLISKRTHGKHFMVLSLTLLVVNFFFISYNRVPMVYSMLACLCIFSIWLLTLSISNTWIWFLSLCVVILTATYLKFFIFLILPFVMVVGLEIFKLANRKKIALLTITLILLLMPFLYFKGAYFWWKLRDYNLHFVPNPTVFTKIPVSNWIFIFSKMLPEVFLAFLYPIFFTFRRTDTTRTRFLTDMTMLGFFLLGNLSLFLFEYYPPRFYVFLIPPLCYLCTASLYELLRPSPKRAVNAKVGLSVVTLWIAILTFHLACILSQPFVKAFFYPVILGIFVLSFILAKAILHRNPPHHRITCRPFLVYALIATAILGNLYRYGIWVARPNYSMALAVKEGKVILGDQARIVGPFAHTVGFLTRSEKFWFNFESAYDLPVFEIFKKNGYTHLIVDSGGTWLTIQEHCPELVQHLSYVQSIFIEGYEIKIYRILNGAALSPLEKAGDAFAQKNFENLEHDLENLPPEQNDLPEVNYWRGVLALQHADKTAAKRFWEKTIGINPHFAPAHFQLAQLFATDGNPAVVKTHLHEAFRNVERTPRLLEAWDRAWQQR